MGKKYVLIVDVDGDCCEYCDLCVEVVHHITGCAGLNSVLHNDTARTRNDNCPLIPIEAFAIGEESE